MNFYCRCGFRFHDNTDDLYFKGRLIADQDWNSLWNYIDNGIKSGKIPAAISGSCYRGVCSSAWNAADSILILRINGKQDFSWYRNQ